MILQNDPSSFFYRYTYCHTLGQHDGGQATFSLYDEKHPGDGVTYTMAGGDVCGSLGKVTNHTFSVNVLCDKKVKEAPTSFVIDTTNQCAYSTTFKHAAGCAASRGKGKKGCGFGCAFLIIFFCGGFCYMSGGIAYNIKVLKLEGTDAIPNKAFWAEVPVCIKEGAILSYETVRDKSKEAYDRYKGSYNSLG